MARVHVIPWRYRDGSVNLEVRCLTMHNQEAPHGDLVTHLLVESSRSLTACGKEYRHHGPCATGLQRSGSIDCEECRTLLAACTFTCEVGEAQGSVRA